MFISTTKEINTFPPYKGNIQAGGRHWRGGEDNGGQGEGQSGGRGRRGHSQTLALRDTERPLAQIHLHQKDHLTASKDKEDKEGSSQIDTSTTYTN